MNKEIVIQEPAGIDRVGEYVRVAVPCARGEFMPDGALALIAPDGKAHPVQLQVLKQWPDSSVKWLLADFVATVPAGETAIHRLSLAAEKPVLSSSVLVTPGPDAWTVNVGVGSFDLDVRTFRPFSRVRSKGREILADGCACLFRAQDETCAQPLVEQVTLETEGLLHVVIRMVGRFVDPAGAGLRFFSRLHFFAGSMAVKVEFTLHNPQAASHPGGLWDLGDPGSVLFKELAFAFPLVSDSELHCAIEPGLAPVVMPTAKFSIYQESSGGESWQSPVHRNREGQLPQARKGYIVEAEGKEDSSGLRATPLIWCGAAGVGIAAALPRFWQEFPKGIVVTDGQLRVELFPARYPDLYELQGGEQKTHDLWLDFFGEKDRLAWALNPLQVMVSPADYRASGVLADLPGDGDLVDRFTSAGAILAKRELSDEYGWRNYGEVYADHEGVNHQGEQPFVSHYNNQYDFIAGAYRKAFALGDHGWQKLAAELAAHVRDIDLYHTEQDREEYNHGLFWHTDHYTDVGLCTHRSYSREQTSAYELHAEGGGPGAEHCYATGLMLHYFQTGNPEFKQAVIDLAEWELLALSGSQTVLAALKRGVDTLNLWRNTRGELRLFPRHPLTRGTGNAITTCLDAYEVGGGRQFLDRAEELIRNTLHPEDDLACRDLLNAEIAWSYTVLLAAVAKYLDKKTELEQFDSGFAHARASLLAYAEWMAKHEYPYLEKPEILEYPNETWAAQDLRKSVIFYQAACYADSEEQRSVFLERARFFYDYAREELLKHPSSSFTRPVVLMLQNGWVGDRLAADVPKGSFSQTQKPAGRPMPYLSLGAVLSRIGSEVVQALRQTSLKRELAWLRARMG